MALVEWNAWALAYLVILVLAAGALIGILVTAARRPSAMPEPASAAAVSAPEPERPGGDIVEPEGETLAAILRAGHDPAPYMAQFVHDAEGERVGETIGIEGSDVIVKTSEGFASVPQDAVTYEGGKLVASGDIDWDAAADKGEAWRIERHKELRYDEHGNPVADEEG